MRLSLVIGTLMTLVMAHPVQAQEFGRVGKVETAGTSYYVFAPAGEATVRVLVLGSVRSPGVYEVGEQTTDLGQLLALAGGTGLGPLTLGEERRVTVRLLREEEGRRTLLYEALWEDMLAEPVQYPVLRDGDVLMVETVLIEHNKFSVRDGLQILTALSTIALLIDRIVRRSN